MALLYLLSLSLLCSEPLLSQLVPTPRFSFERVSFGQTLQEVKSTLKGKTLLKYPTSLSPGLKTRTQDTTVFYEDTCFSSWVGVGLVFVKETKRLVSVAVLYKGVDPNSGETVLNLQREVERLWTAFRKRYGEKAAREQESLFGLVLSWDYAEVKIRMLRTAIPGPALFLAFEPQQP